MCVPHSHQQAFVVNARLGLKLRSGVIPEKRINKPGNRQGSPLAAFLGLWVRIPSLIRAKASSAAFLAV